METLWVGSMKNVRLLYRLPDVRKLRELCSALRNWARRKSVYAYYDVPERQPLSCYRPWLPTLRALDLGPPKLAAVTVQTEVEGWLPEGYACRLAALERFGANALHGRLSFYATEGSMRYDHRLKSDLVVGCGRREKVGASQNYTYFCAMRMGLLSRAITDNEYRNELFDRSHVSQWGGSCNPNSGGSCAACTRAIVD